jgi:hypothetical protein
MASPLGAVLTACVCASLLGGCESGPRRSPGAPLTAEVVSLGAGGPTPASVLVLPGGRVEFVNEDATQHQVASSPHPSHASCPELDGPALAPGESFVARMPLVARVCGYHDEVHPDDATYSGFVDVEAPAFYAPTPITAGGRF